MSNNQLTTLPSLPRLPKAPKPTRPCACGCGGETKSRFVPGHDSRLRGWMLRVERGLMTLEEIFQHTGGTGEAEATARALGMDWTPAEQEERKEARS